MTLLVLRVSERDLGKMLREIAALRLDSPAEREYVVQIKVPLVLHGGVIEPGEWELDLVPADSPLGDEG